jgi:type VII secretion protein EccE
VDNSEADGGTSRVRDDEQDMSPRSLNVPGRRHAGSDGSAPVSIALVVRAEAAALVAVIALLGVGVRSMPTILAGAIGAAALTTVSLDGRMLTGWAGLVIGYAARPRTRAIPTVRAPGRRRRRMRRSAPKDAVTALLPGAVLVHAYDRDGREFAMLAWRGLLTAIVAVDAPEDPVVNLSRPVRVPLLELAAVLQRPDLSLGSVHVVSEAWPVRPLAAVGHLATTVARRRTYVAVQAQVEGNQGIALRGGGAVGITRLLAAAARRAELALAAAGAQSHPLVPTEWRAMLASSAGLDRNPGDLRERWSDLITPTGRCRTFAVEVEDAAAGAVDALIAPAADVVTTSVVLTGGPPRCAVRVSAPERRELDTATAQLTAAATRAGLRLRSLPGAQLAGLRETLPLGAAEC